MLLYLLCMQLQPLLDHQPEGSMRGEFEETSASWGEPANFTQKANNPNSSLAKIKNFQSQRCRFKAPHGSTSAEKTLLYFYWRIHPSTFLEALGFKMPFCLLSGSRCRSHMRTLSYWMLILISILAIENKGESGKCK